MMISHKLHPCVSLCVSASVGLKAYVCLPFLSGCVLSVPATNKYNVTILSSEQVLDKWYWLTTDVYLSN